MGSWIQPADKRWAEIGIWNENLRLLEKVETHFSFKGEPEVVWVTIRWETQWQRNIMECHSNYQEVSSYHCYDRFRLPSCDLTSIIP